MKKSYVMYFKYVFFALFSKVCARYTVVCHRFSILNRNNCYLHRITLTVNN